MLLINETVQIGQTNFPKPHHFDREHDVTYLTSANPRPNNSKIPRGDGADLPAWVAFDKQVLSFDAFYTEEVTQRPSEPYRVHRCKVLFYLEDDSLQVVEPRNDNSGLSQGRPFLSRVRLLVVLQAYYVLCLPKNHTADTFSNNSNNMGLGQ